jgi:hypothetical protein
MMHHNHTGRYDMGRTIGDLKRSWAKICKQKEDYNKKLDAMFMMEEEHSEPEEDLGMNDGCTARPTTMMGRAALLTF